LLPLKPDDRVRMLAAVAHRGPSYLAMRIVVITFSLAILLAVPLFGYVRIDLWGGEHLLMKEPVDVIKALKGFVVAMSILYGATFVSNIFVGRFFCGWGCPVGYVSRLGEDIQTKKKKGQRIFHHLKGAGFVAVFVGAVMLWWVDPRVMIDGSWKARMITSGVFFALWGGGFLHASKWRFKFCLSACPIGLYYRYVTSKAAIGIVFREDPNPCIQCHACEKICPVLLDPKHLGEEQVSRYGDPEATRYGDAECLRCGDCVEACRLVFLPQPGSVPPLRFGRSDDEPLGPAMHEIRIKEPLEAIP
jgi:ferredoxin-type protein NapH